MKKQIRNVILPIISAAALLLAACGAPEDSAADKQIKIAYPNWAEGIAMTQLVDHLLDDMGYDVELTMADPGLIYASLAEGSQDVLLDAWLPITHESYMTQYGNNLDDLGTTFEGARIGLVVPSYVDIQSIEELPAHVTEFEGQIIGIGQGAGIMKKTTLALTEYKLGDYELIPSSGPAMTTALDEAIEDNKAIVVTGWQPHWKFARYDLKFLEDPKGVYGQAEGIHKITRKGFAKDQPEAAALLSKMKLTGEELGSLMDALRNTKTDAEQSAAVDTWIETHQELINSWK
ncbi:MAG: glycine betaine ABC transporter substrate-binding protein [Opitutales bacterium]|nr:glycine betaine ABC transporter substrate-binding protein [Opitutales bacterium]